MAACRFRYNLKYRHNTTSTVTHFFCKQPKQPDFHFKISEFLVAIKLTDKSGYPDNGYPDLQTLGHKLYRPEHMHHIGHTQCLYRPQVNKN